MTLIIKNCRNIIILNLTYHFTSSDYIQFRICPSINFSENQTHSEKLSGLFVISKRPGRSNALNDYYAFTNNSIMTKGIFFTFSWSSLDFFYCVLMSHSVCWKQQELRKIPKGMPKRTWCVFQSDNYVMIIQYEYQCQFNKSIKLII